MRRADGAGQDWCLQCGAGAPGSLDGGGPSWRSAAVILTATAVLVLGAAAAAYAALNKEGATKAHPTIVAVTPTPTTAATTPTPHDAGNTHAHDAGSGHADAESLRNTARYQSADLHRLGQPAENPAHGAHAEILGHDHHARENQRIDATTTPSASGESGGGARRPNRSPPRSCSTPTRPRPTTPTAIPASEFGDPSLAIDGDTSTAWTAQVNPAVAPKMAEGLVIDLKSAQRLSAVELVTSTPGMSVQVYGANGQHRAHLDHRPGVGSAEPLSDREEAPRADQTAGLDESVPLHHAVDQQGPRGSVGTAEAPGHVSVNELELFPAEVAFSRARFAARFAAVRLAAHRAFRALLLTVRFRGGRFAAGRFAAARGVPQTSSRNAAISSVSRSGCRRSSTSELASSRRPFGSSFASMPASEKGCTGSR